MPTNLFDLSGRSALVTGGSKGLGKAMARAFAEAGADVAISSRHQTELQAAAAEIREGTNARVPYLVADMTRRPDVDRLADWSVETLGKVDILVNNAGSNLPQPIDQLRDEDWDQLIQLNLTSCMALSRALAAGMKARRWGRIIHISSVLGLTGKGGRSIYCATKTGLIGLARASAIDLGPYGVTVNCIAPGPFLTDLPMNLLSEEEKAQFAARTALGRWADPRELAGTALLLASEAGSYISGTTITVDGGLLAKGL
ncbi:MAG: SDR family NAD(P)-dependent oxidoreductase [Isosphaeraceae bacterium]|nr:SDR family NAD(P)-dependent oxidoreductase [Isosphaeraceae bacterium]